jgi:hypothetical protein
MVRVTPGPDLFAQWGSAVDVRRLIATVSEALNRIAETEVDHFANCRVCGALLDMRDLAQMLAHVRDAEIEIREGLKPPRARGAVQ